MQALCRVRRNPLVHVVLPYLKLEMGTELQNDWGGEKQIEEGAGRRKEIGGVLTEWNAMDRCWQS